MNHTAPHSAGCRSLPLLEVEPCSSLLSFFYAQFSTFFNTYFFLLRTTLCFAFIAFFRKYLIGIDKMLDIVLGSMPNFIAVMVISLFITDRKQVVGIYKYIIIVTVT